MTSRVSRIIGLLTRLFLFFSAIAIVPCCTLTSEAAGDFQPVDDRVVPTTQILFHWAGVIGITEYHLQVAEAGDGGAFAQPVVDLFVRSPAWIVHDGFEFGKSYRWRVRSVDENGDTLDWSDTHHFQTVEVPNATLNAFSPDVYSPEEMQPGVTISTSYLNCIWGIQGDGTLVWYLSAEEDFYTLDVGQMPNGRFKSIIFRGLCVFNVLGDTLWSSEGFDFFISAHHEMNVKSDGNIFTLFQLDARQPDSLVWISDRILELTTEGDIEWAWRLIDHISMEDVDSSFYNDPPPGGRFDWTHSNACRFEPEESAIYLSIRNLSRIIKIDYPSGRIIWSMGRQWPSGDVDFGENLDFHRQHAPELLPNGNLLFFDNHWMAGEQSEWSRAMEVDFDFDRENPAEIVWEYRIPWSRAMGDVDRLPNGNTLITSGLEGTIYEVTPDSQVVWQVKPTIRNSYRSERIDGLYPLAFSLIGPHDSSGVEIGGSYVSFRIDNVGEQPQWFSYSLTDRLDWYRPEDGRIEIRPGWSAVISGLGNVPDNPAWNRVQLVVEPLVDPALAETLSVALFAGDPDDVESLEFLPQEIVVGPCYPNPFNGATSLSIDLPARSEFSVRIYDSMGRTVWLRKNRKFPSGTHKITWNGSNKGGSKVTSGTYYLLLKGEKSNTVQSITYLP